MLYLTVSMVVLFNDIIKTIKSNITIKENR